jgi:hypothetical protein
MDALDDLAGELILDVYQILPQEIPSLRIRRSYEGRMIHHQYGDSEPVEEIAQGFRKIREELLRALKTNPMRNGTRFRNRLPRIQSCLAPSANGFHLAGFPLLLLT